MQNIREQMFSLHKKIRHKNKNKYMVEYLVEGGPNDSSYA